jgi:hypothetical protein
MTSKVKGYVYIISNQAYKGMVKIGKARNPAMRLKQLSGSTGNLYKFRMEAYFGSDDYTLDERKAHDLLRPWRVKSNKEFYSLSSIDAINKLSTLFGPPRFIKQKHITKLGQMQQQEARRQTDAQEAALRTKQRRAAELEEAWARRHQFKVKLRLIITSLIIAIVLAAVYGGYGG